MAKQPLSIIGLCLQPDQPMKEKVLCRVLVGVGMLLLLVGCVLSQEAPYQLATPINELAECKQMILVVVPSWKSTSGNIRLLERSSDGKWTGIRPSFPCVVGKNGLGWGIGLQATGVFGGTTHKRKKKGGDARRHRLT